MSTRTNRRILLNARPDGFPTEADFRMVEAPAPEPAAGEMLVRTIYLSLDPYMRGRMNGGPSYAAPVELGDVMTGGTVGQVVASRHDGFAEGDFVLAGAGWQEYGLSDGRGVRRLDPGVAPISTALGVLGMPGLTAYVGLLEVGELKAGDVVVVSAASGAVGGVVGQIARIKGHRVVGVAGAQKKCDYVVNELGFDACVSHHSETLADDLRAACPDGIDLYFENVGGKVFDAVLPLLNLFARVPVCGRIANYNATALPDGPDRVPQLMGLTLVRRLMIRGFIVFDHARLEPDFRRDVSGWIRSGELKYREDVVEGLDCAVGAFLGLLRGENFGKLLVRVSPTTRRGDHDGKPPVEFAPPAGSDAAGPWSNGDGSPPEPRCFFSLAAPRQAGASAVCRRPPGAVQRGASPRAADARRDRPVPTASRDGGAMTGGPSRRFPDALVLIGGLILLAQAATYVLPAGEFEREGRQVIRGTYHAVEAEPLPPLTFLTAVPAGLADAADVIFFILIVGGVFGVLRATGAVHALIGLAIAWLGGRPAPLVGGMITLFAVGSSTVGMAEEYMPFVPLLVTMCLALRMDAVVGLGIIYVGAGVGYACAALNPFTVLIAQDIAGVELTSGLAVRCLLLGVCLAVGVDHVLRYARRVQADPSRSLVGDVSYASGFELPADVRFTRARMGVVAVFLAGVALFVYGVSAWQWYLTELTAVFLGIALAGAAVARLAPNRVATAFQAGAADLVSTAVIVGFARTIQVVLTEGQVIDTIINGLATPLQALPGQAAAVGMLAVQTVCNLFIPSGSGQAYVTMPIMAPLADLTGLTRQTAVLAYQFGDGFTNMVVPTNALLMGMLALARIPYQRWLKFVAPLLVKLYVVAIAALMLAVRMGY